jgi:hypothetical protein
MPNERTLGPDERPADPGRSSSPAHPAEAGHAPLAEQPRGQPPIDPFAHLAPQPAGAPAESESEDESEMAFEDEYDLDAEPPQLVMIRTYATPVEADIARLALEAAEIPSVLSTDTSLTMPFMIVASGIRLYVPDWAVEEAEEALSVDDVEDDDGE